MSDSQRKPNLVPPLVLVKVREKSPFSPKVTEALEFVHREFHAGKPLLINHLAEVLDGLRLTAAAVRREDLTEAAWRLMEPLNDIVSGLIPPMFQTIKHQTAWPTWKANLVTFALFAMTQAMDAADAHLKEPDAARRVLPIVRRRLPDTQLGTLLNWRGELARKSGSKLPVGVRQRYKKLCADAPGNSPRERYDWAMLQLNEVFAPDRKP
jgi:hypothetical protein